MALNSPEEIVLDGGSPFDDMVVDGQDPERPESFDGGSL